ncbi:MAG: GtrA-like protein [Alphaproteobacteria bacterium]|nr:GtrA-like protein [Alphaproteobacteria bacterium]
MTTVGYLARHPFVRFAAVGGAGYFVNLAALWLGTHQLGMNSYLAGAFSIFVAMIFTWLGNRYFTFAARRARGSARAVAREFVTFVGANLLGAVVNYAVYAGLLRYAAAPFDDKYIAQACGVGAGLVFNFTLSRLLVFRAAA